MIPLRYFVVAILLALAGTAAAASDYPLDTDGLDARVRSAMAEADVPGLVIGVVVGDDLVYQAAFGVMNVETREPMTTQAIFQIASVTKVFTAALLASLADEGLVSIHDPIGPWLPEGLPLQDPRIRQITFAQLASHSSGLPQEPINRRDRPGGPSVMEPYSRQDLWDGLADTELLWEPGQAVHYSSLGTNLLGVLLERVTSSDLETLVTERVLAPLGMNASRVGLPDSPLVAAHHWPHLSPREPAAPWEFGEAWGHGGLSSTIEDLARFVSLQFEGTAPQSRALTPAAIRRSHQPLTLGTASWDWAYALGWQVMPLEGVGQQIAHDGNVDGHSAYVAALPADGVGFIVLANLGGVADDIGETLADVIYAPLVEAKRELSQAFAEGDEDAIVSIARTQLLTWNPHNPRALYFSGRAAANLGDCGSAEPALGRSAEAGIYRDFALYYLAVCAAGAGDIEAAETLLLRAHRLGFIYPERMIDEPRMAPLRETPIYQKLLDYLH